MKLSTCSICKTAFETRRKHALFCSEGCADIWAANYQRGATWLADQIDKQFCGDEDSRAVMNWIEDSPIRSKPDDKS